VYPYMNEDAAWQRLKDLQREMENSRQMAQSRPWAAVVALGRLGARVWLLAGMAAQRPPRRTAVLVEREDDRGSEVA
jgi:hypothetical protein